MLRILGEVAPSGHEPHAAQDLLDVVCGGELASAHGVDGDEVEPALKNGLHVRNPFLKAGRGLRQAALPWAAPLPLFTPVARASSSLMRARPTPVSEMSAERTIESQSIGAKGRNAMFATPRVEAV